MPATIFRRPLAAVLGAVLLAAQGAASASVPSVGQAAPALVAQSFSGEKFDLSALHGKVVVLNFWASWCGPCRSEMPLLDTLSRDLGERVVVVGFSADDPHDRKDALAAAKGVSYFTGMLSEARVNGFGSPQVLPLTYVITATGTISAVLLANQGPLSADRLRSAIAAALSQAPPAEARP